MLISSSIPTAVPGSLVRICFGRGQLNHLGELAAIEGGHRILLVTDPGIVAAGHADRAAHSLRHAGIETIVFAGVQENPSTIQVEAGLALAREHEVDFIVGLGGGSSMDCAKGINFLLTNGGTMRDYWGVGKAAKPMLPLIAIPTTAGTGSDAQSFALITDPATHQKMACGDHKALPRLAILDPDLTATCPFAVAAATGIDAVAHAVETAGCNKRTDTSRRLSREAWGLLQPSLAPALYDPAAALARERMLLGAHIAGAAIQNSMLGAAHACANPLTAKFGIVHGIAVGLMLPHVVRFNTQDANSYADLDPDPAHLLRTLSDLLTAARIPASLREMNVPESALPELASLAATQWTATFNPRAVAAPEFLEIYQNAFSANAP